MQVILRRNHQQITRRRRLARARQVVRAERDVTPECKTSGAGVCRIMGCQTNVPRAKQQGSASRYKDHLQPLWIIFKTPRQCNASPLTAHTGDTLHWHGALKTPRTARVGSGARPGCSESPMATVALLTRASHEWAPAGGLTLCHDDRRASRTRASLLYRTKSVYMHQKATCAI